MKKRFAVLLVVAIFVLPLVLFASAPTKDLKVTKIGNKKGRDLWVSPLPICSGAQTLQSVKTSVSRAR